MSYNGVSSIWSTIPGLFESLGQFIKDNLSAKKTAENLSELAGQYISKNAVIGKARRDGLPAFQSGEDGKYARKPKQPRKSRQVPINITRQKVPSREFPGEILLPTDFLGLPLIDLPKNGCRYPSGDGPFFFCGQPQWGNSSYCRHHHRVCNTGIPAFRKQGESNVSYGTPGGPLPNSRGRASSST